MDGDLPRIGVLELRWPNNTISGPASRAQSEFGSIKGLQHPFFSHSHSLFLSFLLPFSRLAGASSSLLPPSPIHLASQTAHNSLLYHLYALFLTPTRALRIGTPNRTLPLPATRRSRPAKMLPTQDPQVESQPVNVAPPLTSDQQNEHNADKTCTMVLPNLSFPFRLSSQVPKRGSPVPLHISNTVGMRYDNSFMYSSGISGLVNQPTNTPQAPASRGMWAKMKTFVSLTVSALGRKLKMVKERLPAVRLRSRVFVMV